MRQRLTTKHDTHCENAQKKAKIIAIYQKKCEKGEAL